MRPSLVSSSLLLTASLSTVTALEALVNSPCAVQCGNDLGGTSASDIVCPDSSYTSTSAGQTFMTCITCQLGSTYQDPVTNTTDLQWGLYNVRWALSYCLFGFPNNTAIEDTPCMTSRACGPLESSIESDSLAPNGTAYSYCPLWEANSFFVTGCTSCLSYQSTEYYLRNFLTALNAGCTQQPAPGSTISIQGSLFSTTAVNITTPSATAGAYVPSTGLSLAGKVGIAVGALILCLIILGFCIIWNGKRRRRAVLRRVQQESGFDEWSKQHNFGPDQSLGASPSMANATPQMGSTSRDGFFDSPDSQRPLHSWSARPMDDESPIPAFGEKAYFSPYTSNYSSPISAQDAIPPMGLQRPVERKIDIHDPNERGRTYPMDRKSSVASGSGKASSWSRDTKEKVYDGGQFEMQNVAPILKHPGHGRGGSTSSVALTEEDARRGAAL